MIVYFTIPNNDFILEKSGQDTINLDVSVEYWENVSFWRCMIG